MEIIFLTDGTKQSLQVLEKGTAIYDSCLILGDVKVGKEIVGSDLILAFGDGSGSGLTLGIIAIYPLVFIYTHDTTKLFSMVNLSNRQKFKIGDNVYIGPNSILSMGIGNWRSFANWNPEFCEQKIPHPRIKPMGLRLNIFH